MARPFFYWGPRDFQEGGTGGAKLALTTTSAQSAAIAADYIDVIADVSAFIKIGTNPTAVVDTSYYIASGLTYRFPIKAGDKLAGVLGTGAGNLWYHPIS